DFAYAIADGLGQHVWIHRESGGETKVTSGDGYFMAPAWRGDTRDLSYSTGLGEFKLWSKSTESELLPKGSAQFLGTSWSPDGRSLAVMQLEGNGGWNVLVLSAAGTRNPRLEPVAATPALETRPEFSRDGRFIAYVSNEKNKDRTEVYIRRY